MSVIDAVRYSVEIGFYLIAMRNRLGKHGEWLPLLKAKCAEVRGFPSFEMAQKDMTAARMFCKLRSASKFDPALLDEATAAEIGRQVLGHRSGRRKLGSNCVAATQNQNIDDDLSMLPNDMQELVQGIINKYEKRLQKLEQENKELRDRFEHSVKIQEQNNGKPK